MRSGEKGYRVTAGLGLLTAALVVLLAAACGGGPSPEEVAQGQVLFRKTCATCHGPDARGMPKLGKDLHANAFVQNRSDSEMVEFIKQGRPAWHPENERGVDMPPRGGNPALTDEDLRLIVQYLRTLQE